MKATLHVGRFTATPRTIKRHWYCNHCGEPIRQGETVYAVTNDRYRLDRIHADIVHPSCAPAYLLKVERACAYHESEAMKVGV